MNILIMFLLFVLSILEFTVPFFCWECRIGSIIEVSSCRRTEFPVPQKQQIYLNNVVKTNYWLLWLIILFFTTSCTLISYFCWEFVIILIIEVSSCRRTEFPVPQKQQISLNNLVKPNYWLFWLIILLFTTSWTLIPFFCWEFVIISIIEVSSFAELNAPFLKKCKFSKFSY